MKCPPGVFEVEQSLDDLLHRAKTVHVRQLIGCVRCDGSTAVNAERRLGDVLNVGVTRRALCNTR